jgi:hypothetical protein
MDRLKICTRMSSSALLLMIDLRTVYMSLTTSSGLVSMRLLFAKMNSDIATGKKTSSTYCDLEPKGCRTNDVSSRGAW